MRIKHTTEVYFNNQLFHFRLASKQITAKQTATEEIELGKKTSMTICVGDVSILNALRYGKDIDLIVR